MDDLVRKDEDIYRNVFGAEPTRLTCVNPASAARTVTSTSKATAAPDQLIETRKRISKLERSLVAQSHSLEELFDLARNQEEMLQAIPAIQPVSNEDLTRIASGFGYRIHPIYRVPKMPPV